MKANVQDRIDGIYRIRFFIFQSCYPVKICCISSEPQSAQRTQRTTTLCELSVLCGFSLVTNHKFYEAPESSRRRNLS